MLGAEFSFILVGMIAGLIAGMLPGVGMAVLMIITYPILYTFEPIQVIQFYLSAILISQFIGSVVATYFAIPGEPSSIPAVIEGHKLARDGKATQAIFISAIGSFIGGLIAFIFLYILGLYLMDIFKIFITGFNVIIITLVFVLIFLTPSKNIFEKFGFPILGGGLSLIGTAPLDINDTWLTFGIEALEVGIPDMALLLGLYTLPLLWVLSKSTSEQRQSIERFNLKEIYFSVRHFILSLIHGVYGFLMGFIPGIGLSIVSNTAYAIQIKLNEKLKLKTPGENSLLAAETANNSGAFAIVLPLLIFGIPTTTSQAILYNVLIDMSYDFGPLAFNAAMIDGILFVIMFTCFAGFILAGPMGRILALVFGKFQKHIYAILSVLMVVITLYVGYTALDFWLYFWVTTISCAVGLWWRNYDILRIIYFFIITPFFVENWTRLAFILNFL